MSGPCDAAWASFGATFEVSCDLEDDHAGLHYAEQSSDDYVMAWIQWASR